MARTPTPYLFQPTVVSYTLPDGSHRTPTGKRVTSKTPGAVRTVTKSKKWYGRLPDGTRVPLAESKDIAKRMLDKLRGDAQMEAVGIPVQMRVEVDRPLTEHAADYRQHLEAKGNTDDYVGHTHARILDVLNGCNVTRWRQLDRDAVMRYQHERRKENDGERFGISTFNHYLVAIKGFTRWMATTRPARAPLDPFYGVKKLNAEVDVRVQRRALPDADFAALLDAATKGPTIRLLTGPDRATLYRFAAYTGLRASELASLTPAAFDLDAVPATVEVKAGAIGNKKKKAALLVLRPDVADMMRTFMTGKPRTAQVWQGNDKAPFESWHLHAADILRQDLEAAELAYEDDDGRVFDFHSLRHQFITNLVRAGVELQTAQKLARHSTPMLTANVYTHLDLSDQAAALDKLPPVGGEKGRARGRRKK